MVQEDDAVLILENAKAIVIAHNFAEGATFVEFAELRVHERLAAVTLWQGRIRLAQKTTDFSIWECRGSSTRALCVPVQWHSPRRLYSSSPWRRPVDQQGSCRASVRWRLQFRRSARWRRCKAQDSARRP